ncbi:hypothetical protein R5R35_012632 [Gryllus longicercus]|uniref:SWI/SNF-related matrix-associated actin-dependent regulator of chromatin subfamily A containing DEAD/H box 1 homolog n=1 Tax=Gryllus longicercus TaxID=2509291 RepID=A0AAN9V631_9ORTH
MSEESSSSDVTSSPSLLTNLRQFRFQKNAMKLKPSKTLPSSPPEVGNRKKVVRRIQESDTEEEVETPVTVTADVIKAREKCLCILVEAFPTVDKMVLQDVLVNHKWNAESAKKELFERYPGQGKRPRSEEDTNSKKKKARKDLDVDGEGSDFDEGDNPNLYKEKVFDSDESGDEMPDELSVDQKQVLQFLSKATIMELKTVPSVSHKKAEAIIEKRPFEDWKDLVEKLKNGKYLGTDILNNVQEFLHMRLQVETLMTKCMKLSKKMASVVLDGTSGIKEQPSLLNDSLTLAGYQMVGLNWLLMMHNQELNGILADEMGLGKTVQVIAFFAHLKESSMENNKKPHHPHVVVVPSSTLDNWRKELERWCPALNVVVYHGSQFERKSMRVKWVHDGMEGVDVILTTYNTMTSTPEEKKMFRVLPFHYAVIDEAHLLKNMTTQRYETMMRVNAEHRILLTGTPLQNTLMELMSLLIFVMPKMFAGKKDHLKSLFTKIPKQGIKENEEPQEKLSVFEQTQVANARQIMKPFVLRRLKADVLKDLPQKTNETLYCPMTESQKEKYDELINAFKNSASGDGGGSDGNETSFMGMLMQLRKLANHPLLLRYHYQDDQLLELAEKLAADPTYKEENKDYIFEDLQCFSDFEIHTLTQEKGLNKYYLPLEMVLESGKFKMFDELLPKLKSEDHRVLIFSQFVIVLNIIEEYLQQRNHLYLRLDGSTPVAERQELIDTYTEDTSIFIFLLSTRAGGVGINLTAADTVIIHDIDFNPHNDKQAEDRCHRVGQSRDVRVIRMLSKGTIEEGIYEKAKEKLTLEREINSEDGKTAETKSVLRLIKETLGFDVPRSVSCAKKS